MLLSRYGYREIMLITAICATAALGAIMIMWWPLAIAAGALWLALLAFFRDPMRRIPADLGPGDMLSPADGVVTAIERLKSHESVEGPAVLIRIFLSILDVHINRAPCDCEVLAVRHAPGRFINAQREESARLNESRLFTLRINAPDANGISETIGLRQVAGMIARTIVSPLKPGDRLQGGQKFGMIKFGSTTELILPRPDDVQVHVRKGEKVRAGLTRIATLGDVARRAASCDAAAEVSVKEVAASTSD